MASPFTFTPGIAGEAYIDMHYAEEIIENFISETSEKYVYKILGLRGSGKSVVYSKVLSAMRNENKWLVYSLSAGGDPVQTLIGLLSKEKFVSNTVKKLSIKTEGVLESDIAVIKGSGKVGTKVDYLPDSTQYSTEAILKDMVMTASNMGYSILVGIDDIAKTPETTAFLSLIGDMILDETKRIYLVCTGLTKNIEDFISEPHLSFFVRGNKIEIGKLSIPQISFKYRSFLNADKSVAKTLAEFTKGYAYAYQVVGELCYKHNTTDISLIVDEFDAIIADQYDLIWSSLAPAEKELANIIATTENNSVENLKSRMKNKSSFSVLRSRLIKKHVVTAGERGTLSIELPRINEYINTWVLA